MPDLIGIGSINVDLVIDSTSARAIDLTDERLGLAAEDIGGERAIDAERSRVALEYAARFGPAISAGGSSLNVMAAVAGTGAPVTVGQVGVCGTDGPAGFSLPHWFDRSGIDATEVHLAPGPPGLCLAITYDGERTLLTTGGVNDRLGHLVRDRGDELVDHLGRARIVHLTSVTGLDDLEPLIDLLDRLRQRAPEVLVSGDPGAIWTGPDRPAGAGQILSRCHQLLVNRREFVAIGAEAVFDRHGSVETVVVKGAEAVEVRRRDGRVERHPNPGILSAAEIVDDTGAGDAFAAGFLIGQLVDEIGPSRGVELGMDLARVKLGFPGMSAVDRFASVLRQHLAQT